MKIKTSKSAKKRVINITKNGKIVRRPLSGQHLTAGKSKRTLRASNKYVLVSSKDSKKIKQLIAG